MRAKGRAMRAMRVMRATVQMLRIFMLHLYSHENKSKSNGTR